LLKTTAVPEAMGPPGSPSLPVQGAELGPLSPPFIQRSVYPVGRVNWGVRAIIPVRVTAWVVPKGDVPLQSYSMLPEEPAAGAALIVRVEQFAVKTTVPTAGNV